MPRQGNARMRSEHNRRGPVVGHIEGQPRTATLEPKMRTDDNPMNSEIHRNSFSENPLVLKGLPDTDEKIIDENR